jgi:hypothetical protein
MLSLSRRPSKVREREVCCHANGCGGGNGQGRPARDVGTERRRRGPRGGGPGVPTRRREMFLAGRCRPRVGPLLMFPRQLPIIHKGTARHC